MNLNEIEYKSYEVAVSKGYKINCCNKTFNIPTALCLIHSEISEALEEYRDGKPINEELADIVIRVFHLASTLKINMEKEILNKIEFGKKRPYKHGRKVL